MHTGHCRCPSTIRRRLSLSLPRPWATRIANPTVTYLEERVRQVTGAASVTALNMGMTAIHPVSTIFGLFTAEQCAEMSVLDTTVRLSIGLEASEDLLEDIKTAIK